MKTLGFARRSCVVNGLRVRPSFFQSRSMLPVSAACLVANSARQTLSDLLGTVVSLKLLEPIVPDGAGWSSIGADALVFAVRGAHSDAAIVLRPHDALALACAALGERTESPRCLSTIETELAARIASGIEPDDGGVRDFVGRIDGVGFTIRQRNATSRMHAPVLHGRIEADGTGSVIHAYFGTDLWSRVLVAMFAAAVLVN